MKNYLQNYLTEYSLNRVSICFYDFTNAESSSIDTNLFGFSARNIAIRATTDAAAVATATTATESAAGVFVLGDGARTVPRVAMPRILETATHLREMLDPCARLSAGQSHCHPSEWDEIAGR